MPYNPFDPNGHAVKVYRKLAANQLGIEWTPEEAARHMKEFYQKVQDGLSRQGVWLTLEETVKVCIRKEVVAAVTALEKSRGGTSCVDNWVDVVSSIEFQKRKQGGGNESAES